MYHLGETVIRYNTLKSHIIDGIYVIKNDWAEKIYLTCDDI